MRSSMLSADPPGLPVPDDEPPDGWVEGVLEFMPLPEYDAREDPSSCTPTATRCVCPSLPISIPSESMAITLIEAMLVPMVASIVSPLRVFSRNATRSPLTIAVPVSAHADAEGDSSNSDGGGEGRVVGGVDGRGVKACRFIKMFRWLITSYSCDAPRTGATTDPFFVGADVNTGAGSGAAVSAGCVEDEREPSLS